MFKTLVFGLVILFASQSIAKDFVIDFTATWCGPCQSMKPALRSKQFKDALEKRNADFYEIDIDRMPEYAKMWEVTTIPCVVLGKVENGETKEIRRVVGSRSLNQLIKFLE